MKRFATENLFLRNGIDAVVGCDEVGRGSLAGPVVAAAVTFNKPSRTPFWWKFVNDSKTLTPANRKELSEQIKDCAAAWGIGKVSHEQIDKINIHNASLKAMHIAVKEIVKKLQNQNLQILIDGKFQIPNLKYSQQAIIKGDSKVHSIAAASILAKVYRDELMEKLDETYPQYLFAKHKGYATLAHRKAIVQHGLSSVHRVSFCDNIFSTQPVKNIAS